MQIVQKFFQRLIYSFDSLFFSLFLSPDFPVFFILSLAMAVFYGIIIAYLVQVYKV